jgi:hypothetical protein
MLALSLYQDGRQIRVQGDAQRGARLALAQFRIAVAPMLRPEPDHVARRCPVNSRSPSASLARLPIGQSASNAAISLSAQVANGFFQ